MKVCFTCRCYSESVLWMGEEDW